MAKPINRVKKELRGSLGTCLPIAANPCSGLIFSFTSSFGAFSPIFSSKTLVSFPSTADLGIILAFPGVKTVLQVQSELILL